MDEESRIAIELADSRQSSGLSRERVAQALGVSAKTIERWEKSGRIGPAELREIRAFYASGRQTGLYNDVPRGTSALADATALPGHLTALARRFELEMARLGATNEEVDHVDATLRSEHVAVLINQRPDGSPRTGDERDAEFRLQMRALLRWLLMRMEFLNRTPGDVSAIDAIIGASPALPSGAKFEADHATKAERPSTAKRKGA